MTSQYGRVEVAPANLSFFTIFSPALSSSDDNLEDQILYYYSSQNDRKTNQTNFDHDVENERLRQIGLAQGMVEFAKGFSEGQTIDTVDTERSRIVLHEIEPGWWLLTSVCLTRITRTPVATASDGAKAVHKNIEYSNREVSSAALILQQLLRAHRVFLLHHGVSLADVLDRVGRKKLCTVLQRFWDTYIARWDILLHGNPAIDIFNALKLASGGELGIGVGEEEWGSGEREVLEDFITRTPGLLDIVVCRYGVDDHEKYRDTVSATKAKSSSHLQSPLPTLKNLETTDGVIFSGIKAVSRRSVQVISSWMETLHVHGEDAYGVYGNPSSSRPRKKRKVEIQGADRPHPQKLEIPPSLFAARSHESSEPLNQKPVVPNGEATGKPGVANPESNSGFDTATMMKFLTLGVYGSKWSTSLTAQGDRGNANMSKRTGDPDGEKDVNHNLGRKGQEPTNLPEAYFLVGLRGKVESGDEHEIDDQDLEGDPPKGTRRQRDEWIRSRTIYVERLDTSTDVQMSIQNHVLERVSVVVYIQPPFMFTFLFKQGTDSLSMPSLYQSIHHQLGPLQRPLLASTSPKRVRQRIREAASPKSTINAKSTEPLFELIYDPASSSLHSTIPSIPEVEESSLGGEATWSRIEALTVHSQILNAYEASRARPLEVERTCKTSRGWWVVWMRLPSAVGDRNQPREAFLIRKATDYTPRTARKSSSRSFGLGGGEEGVWGPQKLREGLGIGIDARQYIDGLLSLAR